MRKVASASLALLAWVLLSAQGSVLPGFPPGTFDNRAAIDASTISYTGPGDVVTLTEFWGLRCYNAAYVGNVAEIKSPADALTTTITCAAGGVLGSTGTAIATTCAVSCTVKTLYAQTGSGHDMANPTEATRPAYTLSCATIAKPCMTLNGTSQGLFNVSVGTITQIFSVTVVARRTTVNTTSCILCTNSANDDVAFHGSGQATMIWGSAFIDSAAAENTWHSLQAIGNGVSSTLTVDANAATSGNPGAGSLAGDYAIGANTSLLSGALLAGTVAEVGVKSGDFTSSIIALAANQKAYWGY